MTLLISILTGIFLLEILLIGTVRHYRKQFQWLITEKDEVPALDRKGLEKFFRSSYDPELGWVRRPNSEGKESGRNGTIIFHIDETGSRANPVEAPPRVASFGDSYTFCRQVEDDETWQAQLSKMTGEKVLNFGVGNYGADQALIRYERTALPESVRYVILGFVPETICRVHSHWKHYLEFGNTFAFKPKFMECEQGEIRLSENPMQTRSHFDHIEEHLPRMRERDRFYRVKFRSLQFRVPYLLSFFRHPVRNSALMGSLIMRSLFRIAGMDSTRFEQMPFRQIMKYNIRESHRLYQKEEYTRLLKKILIRFRDQAEKRGHIPVVLVMPQLLDLELSQDKMSPYHAFYRDLEQQGLPVIDVTSRFRESVRPALFVEDHYGGHLSAEGNRLVSETILEWLNHYSDKHTHSKDGN